MLPFIERFNRLFDCFAGEGVDRDRTCTSISCVSSRTDERIHLVNCCSHAMKLTVTATQERSLVKHDVLLVVWITSFH